MRTWPIGSTIWVVGNCNGHGYVLGRAYVVTEVDDDGTCRARDPETGAVGNWLRWQDVDIRPPIGWDYCKTVLPPEIVRFLEAFDGIESIALRDSVKQRLLRKLPDLYGSVLEVQTELAHERPQPGELPQRRVRSEDPVVRFFQGMDDSEDGELAS